MLFPPSLKGPLKEVHAGLAEAAPSTADFMVSDCVSICMHQSLPGNLRPHIGVNLTGYCIRELLPIAIIPPNATKSRSKLHLGMFVDTMLIGPLTYDCIDVRFYNFPCRIEFYDCNVKQIKIIDHLKHTITIGGLTTPVDLDPNESVMLKGELIW